MIQETAAEGMAKRHLQSFHLRILEEGSNPRNIFEHLNIACDYGESKLTTEKPSVNLLLHGEKHGIQDLSAESVNNSIRDVSAAMLRGQSNAAPLPCKHTSQSTMLRLNGCV